MSVTVTTNKPPENNLPAIKQFLSGDSIKNKFVELLGKKAPGFITNVMQVVSGNSLLAKADTNSIYQAAAMAAILDLSVNQSLGQAWIVPYAGRAQFQIGYKGLVQLAHRSGQYKRINVVPVYANQFDRWNALTEEFEANFEIVPEGEPVGYVSYFRLVNGFEKTSYWTRGAVQAHAKRYSKSYSLGPWVTHFDQMAMKTVLKDSLSHWGILSIEMQQAIEADQAVINDTDTSEFVYPDNDNSLTAGTIIPKQEAEEFERSMEFLSKCETQLDITNLLTKIPIERFSEQTRAEWNKAVIEKQQLIK